MAISYCNTNHILIGLGGTGGKILRAFKMRMFEEFPDEKERGKQSVSLLYVDTTKEMMPKDGKGRADFRVMGKDASFTNEEFLFIKGNDVSHILDHIDNYPSVKGIVSNASAVKSAIGNLGEAAGQMRRAGRLLFASNAVALSMHSKKPLHVAPKCQVTNQTSIFTYSQVSVAELVLGVLSMPLYRHANFTLMPLSVSMR